MTDKRIPKRVRINGWIYEVTEGWSGTLNLAKWMNPVEYTVREPYVHMNNLYYVYDMNGNQVGEFETVYCTCKGCVNAIEF